MLIASGLFISVMVISAAAEDDTGITRVHLSECTQPQTDQVACDIGEIEAGFKGSIKGGDTIVLACDAMPPVADTTCDITFVGVGTGEELVINDPTRIVLSNCSSPSVFYFKGATQPDAQFSLECTLGDVAIARSLRAIQLEEPKWDLQMPVLASPSELEIEPISPSDAMRLTSCVASETGSFSCILEGVGDRMHVEKWWLKNGDEIVITQFNDELVGSFIRIEPASGHEPPMSGTSHYLVGEGDQITLDGCGDELSAGAEQLHCTFLEIVPATGEFEPIPLEEGQVHLTLLEGTEMVLLNSELREYPLLSADRVIHSTTSRIATIVDSKSHIGDGIVWWHVELDENGINGWIPQDFFVERVTDSEDSSGELGSLSITGYSCPEASSPDEACMEAGPVEILNATLRLEDGTTMQLAADRRQEDGSYAWLNIPVGEYVLLVDGLLGPDGTSARDVAGASGQSEDGWTIANTDSNQPTVLQVFFVPAGEAESPG
jgi:hypothetical protein